MKQLLDRKTLKYQCQRGKNYFILLVDIKLHTMSHTLEFEVHIIYYNQDHAKTSTSRRIYIINQVQHKIPSIYLDMLSSPDGNQIHVIKQSKKNVRYTHK